MQVKRVTNLLLINSDHSLHKTDINSLHRKEGYTIGDYREKRCNKNGDQEDEGRGVEEWREAARKYRHGSQEIAAYGEEQNNFVPTPKFVVFRFADGAVLIDRVQRVFDDHVGRRVYLVNTVQRAFVVEVSDGHHVFLGTNAVPPEAMLVFSTKFSDFDDLPSGRKYASEGDQKPKDD